MVESPMKRKKTRGCCCTGETKTQTGFVARQTVLGASLKGSGLRPMFRTLRPLARHLASPGLTLASEAMIDRLTMTSPLARPLPKSVTEGRGFCDFFLFSLPVCLTMGYGMSLSPERTARGLSINSLFVDATEGAYPTRSAWSTPPQKK